MTSASRYLTLVLLAAFLFGAVGMQHAYDAARFRARLAEQPMSLAFARTVDLGLHTALASFLWMQHITDLPVFARGQEHFFGTFEVITGLDPAFSFPYFYTSVVLPLSQKYPARIEKALTIGRQGVALADPDWRIPFYLAATYQLEKQDFANAVKFYDVTTQTPGVPDVIKIFAQNFGASQKVREETRNVWEAIYLSARDKLLKERAEKNVKRLLLFDALESAARLYRERTGEYPKTPDDLVSAGILHEAPEDPLGFPLFFRGDGSITINKPPS